MRGYNIKQRTSMCIDIALIVMVLYLLYAQVNITL